MKKAFYYSVLFICCIVIIVIGYFCWHVPITTVILVRHAEKAAIPSDDPPLSPDGILRAQALSHVVEDTDIDVIFATEFQRTQLTVEPTATNLGLTPIIIPAANTEELVTSINSDHKGKEILVVGHSNTVPAIMETLGISSAPVIADNDFDNLFVVHIRHYIFRHAKLTHLKYGNPSP